MPDTDPHTAELVDADPDRRQAPRLDPIGASHSGVIRGTACPPPHRRPQLDTPDASAENLRQARQALSTAYSGVLAVWHPHNGSERGEQLWDELVRPLLRAMSSLDGALSALADQDDGQGA